MYLSVILATILTFNLATAYKLRHTKQEHEPETPICGSPSDLVFVLDASSSIWGPHFRKQLDFVKDVVNNFNIYEDGSGTRIGVVVFSDVEKTKVEFNLNKYYDRKALLAAIGKIRHMTGGTNTHVALKKLREEVFTKQAGARIGEVPQIAIVMTDGVSWEPKQTAKQAKLCHEAGIRMLAVGIGFNIDKKEIASIASSPHDIFSAQSYDTLASIRKNLSIEACPVKEQCFPWTDCGFNKTTDVAFVLGEGTTKTAESTQVALQFVSNITSKFNIGKDTIQVALVPRECQQPGFHFNRFQDKKSVKDHLENYEPLDHSNAGRLNYLRTETFSKKSGARPGVRKLAIVVLDANSKDYRATLEAAKAAKDDGVEIFTIGIGPVKRSELIAISTSPKHVLKMKNYDSFDIDLQRLAYRMICKARTDPDPEDICDMPPEF